MSLIPLEKHTRSPFTAGIKETTIVNGGSKPKLSKQACAVSHEYRDPFWCRKADQNWRINVQVPATGCNQVVYMTIWHMWELPWALNLSARTWTIEIVL
jgi:hypothetical protein